MKFLRIATAAVLLLALAGCTISEKQFVEYRTIIKQRPDVKAKIMASCVAQARKESRDTREVIAAVFDISVEALPQTFCRRLYQFYLSGRMTYQDYKNIMRGKATPRFIRAMRGK
jgi:hypothetical protein